MIRLEGKVVSQKIRAVIKEDAYNLSLKLGRKPGLAVVIVGEDPASQVYVRNKAKACEEVGFYSEVIRLPNETTEAELLDIISKLNRNHNIDGILVQLPLPKHINEERIITSILPSKDVDAFHPVNVGKIMIGNYKLLPCTPAGVMEILKFYGISPAGKHCVVIGRSNIVGKPQALLLLEQNATVTICHSKTTNLREITKQADIIVVAVGRPHFLTADMIKDGAVIIDVGINRLADGTLVGDVDFADVEQKASAITPVPGGVGPMTITMLLRNTLTAAELTLNSHIFS